MWAGEKFYSSILGQCVYVLQLLGAKTHFMTMKIFSHVHISEYLTPGMAIKPRQPQNWTFLRIDQCYCIFTFIFIIIIFVFLDIMYVEIYIFFYFNLFIYFFCSINFYYFHLLLILVTCHRKIKFFLFHKKLKFINLSKQIRFT